MTDRPYHSVGLLWDTFTPAVEGQITRDIIALQSMGPRLPQLMAICNDDSANRVLSALGVKRSNAQALATLWITYRTKEDLVEAPEHATTVIERDLYVPKEAGNLDTNAHQGYYLKPQGRIKPESYNLNRPMPSHSGQTDPMIVLLWM